MSVRYPVPRQPRPRIGGLPGTWNTPLSTAADATIALTGATASTAAGTLSATGGASIALTGAPSTSTGDASIALTGAASTSTAGVVIASAGDNAITALAGAQATSNAGALAGTGGATATLVGAQAVSTAGTLIGAGTAADATVALVGASATSSAGTLTGLGDPVADDTASGGWGTWPEPPKRKKRRLVSEELDAILRGDTPAETPEATQERIEADAVRLRQQVTARRDERRSQQVTAQIKELLDENLGLEVSIIQAGIEDEEAAIALILALA